MDVLEAYFVENCVCAIYEVEHEIDRTPEQVPHVQGYFVLKNKARITALKKVNARAHWEAAKASQADNVAYCSKEFKLNKQVRFFQVGDLETTAKSN